MLGAVIGGSCFRRHSKRLLTPGQAARRNTGNAQRGSKRAMDQQKTTGLLKPAHERLGSRINKKNHALWGLAFKARDGRYRERAPALVFDRWALLNAGA